MKYNENKGQENYFFIFTIIVSTLIVGVFSLRYLVPNFDPTREKAFRLTSTQDSLV